MERVRFVGKSDFYSVCRRRVYNYFVANNLQKNDNLSLYAKAFYFLSVATISYISLLFLADQWWEVLLSASFMAYSLLGIGFNIQHDANHEAFSKYASINRAGGMLLDAVLGLSSFLWKLTHNLWHHTYTNVPGSDGDMEFSQYVRLSPYAKKLACHKFQHLYVWFFYAMAHPSFFVIDYVRLLRGKLGSRDFEARSLRGRELALFILGKAVFITLWVIIPLWARYDSARPVASVMTVLSVYLLIAGCIGLGYQLVAEVAHIVERTSHPVKATGKYDTNWAIHQLATTANFAVDSWFWNFHLGGLNHQAAHHLFPEISHVHYPAIWKIIKEVCKELGVEYHEFATFREAIAEHYRFVKEMGQASDLESELAT